MADPVIRLLTESMRWSYSRVEAFAGCPYRWYMIYLCGETEEPLFYSSYGSFMHRLLASIYTGELSKEEAVLAYITGFSSEVKGDRPSPGVVSSYFEDGLNALRNTASPPFRVIAVERRVDFSVDGLPFVGVVDLVGEDETGLVVVDHKSRSLRPPSGRKKPTANDRTLDQMSDQLYLYAIGVKEKYGAYPYKLCFNAFRSAGLIGLPFSEARCIETARRMREQIGRIRDSDSFPPQPEYYKCRWLCSVKHACCYYDEGRGI